MVDVVASNAKLRAAPAAPSSSRPASPSEEADAALLSGGRRREGRDRLAALLDRSSDRRALRTAGRRLAARSAAALGQTR